MNRSLSRSRFHSRTRLHWFVGLACACGLAQGAAATELAWGRIGDVSDVGEGGDSSDAGIALNAIAVGASGEIVVAEAAGVRWLARDDAAEGAGTILRAALPGVRDLVFTRGGVALIGTELGLFRWPPGGRPERRSLSGGETAAQIRRFASAGDAIAVATRAGAYWSSTGESFSRLQPGAPEDTTLVAIHLPRSDGRAASTLQRAEVFTYSQKGLLVTRGFVTDAGLRVIGRERLDPPRPTSEIAPVDLLIDSEGDRVVMLYPDAIALRPLGSEARAADARGQVGWRLARPALGPGARMHRIVLDASRIIVASNRGLFGAARFETAFVRMSGPFGVEACGDVDGGRGRALVVRCRSGVYAAVPATGRVFAGAAGPPAQGDVTPLGPMRAPPILLPPDPPLAAIRARALARAGLSVSRSEALFEGLRARGFWPDLSLRVGADFARDDRRFSDQAFVSGDYRRLHDRTRDRETGYDATIELDWSLGEVAYPEESVDLSREMRQVIALRDDVSDEIHQLYFERKRLRARLAAGGPFAPGEASTLRVRAEEIFAGLDAWTDGWLTQWRESRRGPSSFDADSTPIAGPTTQDSDDSEVHQKETTK